MTIACIFHVVKTVKSTNAASGGPNDIPKNQHISTSAVRHHSPGPSSSLTNHLRPDLIVLWLRFGSSPKRSLLKFGLIAMYIQLSCQNKTLTVNVYCMQTMAKCTFVSVMCICPWNVSCITLCLHIGLLSCAEVERMAVELHLDIINKGPWSFNICRRDTTGYL